MKKSVLRYFYTIFYSICGTSENRLYSKQPELSQFYVDIIKMSRKVK